MRLYKSSPLSSVSRGLGEVVIFNLTFYFFYITVDNQIQKAAQSLKALNKHKAVPGDAIRGHRHRRADEMLANHPRVS